MNLIFEGYKVQSLKAADSGKPHIWQDNAGAESVHPTQQHFGIAFFDYLSQNLDFNRLDTSIVTGGAVNYNTLVQLACSKPLLFVKAVDEMKRAAGGNVFVSSATQAGASAFSAVFNIQKK